jgi:tetratricopeptide (TPR) repeat protein
MVGPFRLASGMAPFTLILISERFPAEKCMGIDYRLATAILQEHAYRSITGTILLIGRQTIALTPDEAMRLVELQGLTVRKDAKIELDQDTYGSEGRSLITDRSFFSLFSDAEVISLDVSPYEKAEIIFDLNQTLPQEHYGRADFIFNGSCLDNLFDPASALRNLSRLLRPGGRVTHIEHGSPIQTAYIMYSPAYFFDFYAANNYADCKVYACFFENMTDAWNVFLWEAYYEAEGQWKLSGHRHPAWHDILIYVVAEKAEDSTDDLTPIQGFYREVHGSNSSPYFRAFETYRKSSRPLLNLTADATDAGSAPDPCPGFSYVGRLEDPVRKRQTTALALVEQARREMEAKDYTAVVETLTRAIETCVDMGHPGLFHSMRGDAYYMSGDYEAALADYEQALAIHADPTYLAKKENALCMLNNQGSSPEALESRTVFQKAVGRLRKALNWHST